MAFASAYLITLDASEGRDWTVLPATLEKRAFPEPGSYGKAVDACTCTGLLDTAIALLQDERAARMAWLAGRNVPTAPITRP